jgi:hypothetical protein
MNYEYDLFLSYRRDPPVSEWVNNHFYPELIKWLPLEVNRETRVSKIRKSLFPARCGPRLSGMHCCARAAYFAYGHQTTSGMNGASQSGGAW